MKIYIRYQDDGPSGPCGQATSTTSPWDILHIFKDQKSYRKFTKLVESMTWRKNSRITAIWHEYGPYEVTQEVVRH